MNRKHLSMIAAAVCVVIAGLWALHGYHAYLGASAETAEAPRTDVKAVPGKPGIAIDQQERERAGIATTRAQPVELQAQSQAIATALPLQELIDAAASIAAARAQDERARATVAASRRDFERLQGLHAQDRNVSDRALEVAEASITVIRNDGDILRTIHVLAQEVGIIGLFSDWPATTTFYANCMKLK